MFITIINDCKSENDIGRLTTRYSTLFPRSNINFVGLESGLGTSSTLEAAGNLVDILDACSGQKGIVSVNVAPRGQIKEDGVNGSRFCYFFYKKVLVVSTIKGQTLSLVKKLHIVSSVKILNTEEVLAFAVYKKIIDRGLADYITHSQFRSFDFQPRVAKWLVDGIKLPYVKLSIDRIPNPPNAIWLIDSFGNAKTTLTIKDLPCKKAPCKVSTNLGGFNYYERLKLVPDGKTAIYTGSSGIGNVRFLEIATQNRKDSAVGTLKLKVGDLFKIR